MDFIVIQDYDIVAVNCGIKDNEASNILYRDKWGAVHQIDFDACAINYKAENKNTCNNCIGERKIDEWYFVFYTSGIKTKIVFEKRFVFNILHKHLLNGSKANRFHSFQKLISQANYQTFDLS